MLRADVMYRLPPMYSRAMTEPSPAERTTPQSGPPALAIGAALVLIGLALFAAQLLDFQLSEIGWPFFIILAGIGILLFGLFVGGESGIVIGGTITTTVGLVLLFQDTTGRWESWAYAWALVGPAASGLGLAISGMRTGNGNDVRNGTWGLLGGLAIFVIGFLFFEGVIGISGQRLALPEWLLPVAVIAIGLVVLGRGLLERTTRDTPS
ncbi:hypothetical protein BH23CHL10_BH23CHL10_05550 [soil metagenome]